MAGGGTAERAHPHATAQRRISLTGMPGRLLCTYSGGMKRWLDAVSGRADHQYRPAQPAGGVGADPCPGGFGHYRAADPCAHCGSPPCSR